MFLLFLRFIRLFVTSQISNAPLRTPPPPPLDFLHFQVFIMVLSIHSLLVHAKSLYCIFSRVSKSSSVVFYMFSIWFLNFLKALGFCQTLFVILARSLLIFPLFLHLCQVLQLSFSDQSQNLHPLIPCWLLNYYLANLPFHCHHWHED